MSGVKRWPQPQAPVSCLVLAMGFPGASCRAFCSQPGGVIVMGGGGPWSGEIGEGGVLGRG